MNRREFEKRTQIDEARDELFREIGKVRSPFQEVKSWPDIDEELEAASAQLFNNVGTTEWQSTGGIFTDAGKRTFKKASSGAETVVAAIEENHSGVVWYDWNQNDWWATRLFRGRKGRRQGVSVNLDTVTNSTVNLYRRAESILWYLHSQVMRQRRSLLEIPANVLRDVVWGRDYPKDWRRELRLVLLSLHSLRVQVVELAKQGWQPRLDSSSSLIDHLGGFGERRDICCEFCPLWPTDSRHHHYQIGVGHAFMGTLERFATSDYSSSSLRSYDFKKTGGVVPVFPAINAALSRSRSWSNGNERNVLVALLREVEVDGPVRKLQLGNQVPGHTPKSPQLVCPLLDANTSYIGLNGNGVRRGMGYRLIGRNNSGWLSKSSLFGSSNVSDNKRIKDFLKCSSLIAQRLGVVAAGLDYRQGSWLSLQEMIRLSQFRRGWKLLDSLHVRFYAPSSLFECLAEEFGSIDQPDTNDESCNHLSDQELSAQLIGLDLTSRRVAQELRVSPSFLSQMLSGAKAWPVERKKAALKIVGREANLSKSVCRH